MRTARRLAAIVVFLGVAWWLFGFTVALRTETTTLITRRTFGRVTHAHWFVGFAERERMVAPWSEPFEGDPLTDCAATPPEHWVDANQDGRWDTWKRRLGPDRDGRCTVEYQADTNLDGKPDWRFVLGPWEHEKGWAMLKARRGF